MNDRELFEQLRAGSVGFEPGTAAHDVFLERMRQQLVEGFGPQRDDGYTQNELVRAAVCYAYPPPGGYLESPWPWDMSWWKPTTRRRDLVKAAALLLAEIERIDRKERRAGSATGGAA